MSGVNLRGARVLVTGGGSGVGRLMILGAARQGADVVIWDLNQERAEAVADEVRESGGTATAYGIDVTDIAAVKSTAKKVGPVDVLINNAGVVGGRTLIEESEEAIKRTLEVNLESLFWVTKAFLPGMVERHYGYVVTMSSAAGLIAGAKMSDYAASKFGAIGFNEALRNEMRRDQTGVGSMVVCPFYINTGMFDGVKTKVPLLLPILEPEKVAAKILQGVQKGAKQIIMPPFVRTIPLLRMLPVSWLDATADLFGINASMDDFAGRKGDRL